MKDNYNNVRICPYMDPKESMSDRHQTDRYSPISSDLYYNDNLPQFCDLKLDPDILRYNNSRSLIQQSKYLNIPPPQYHRKEQR